jgi:hypothetical protein
VANLSSVARACLFRRCSIYLEAGNTLDEFLEQYPGVSREQAIAALEEAKALVLARFGK